MLSHTHPAIFSFVWQIGKIMSHSNTLLTNFVKFKMWFYFCKFWKRCDYSMLYYTNCAILKLFSNQLLSALTEGLCSFHFRQTDWKNYETLKAITHENSQKWRDDLIFATFQTEAISQRCYTQTVRFCNKFSTNSSVM